MVAVNPGSYWCLANSTPDLGEHIQKAVHRAIDAEVLGVVTRRQGSAQGRGARISQVVERGGQPADVVDPNRGKAFGLDSARPPAGETIGMTPSCIDST